MYLLLSPPSNAISHHAPLVPPTTPSSRAAPPAPKTPASAMKTPVSVACRPPPTPSLSARRIDFNNADNHNDPHVPRAIPYNTHDEDGHGHDSNRENDGDRAKQQSGPISMAFPSQHLPQSLYPTLNNKQPSNSPIEGTVSALQSSYPAPPPPPPPSLYFGKVGCENTQPYNTHDDIAPSNPSQSQHSYQGKALTATPSIKPIPVPPRRTPAPNSENKCADPNQVSSPASTYRMTGVLQPKSPKQIEAAKSELRSRFEERNLAKQESNSSGVSVGVAPTVPSRKPLGLNGNNSSNNGNSKTGQAPQSLAPPDGFWGKVMENPSPSNYGNLYTKQEAVASRSYPTLPKVKAGNSVNSSNSASNSSQ